MDTNNHKGHRKRMREDFEKYAQRESDLEENEDDLQL